MNSFLSSEQILPENIKNAIKKIAIANPSIVFGGSIALCAVGILTRTIHDIDIFIPNYVRFTDPEYNSINLLNFDGVEEPSNTVTDINGRQIVRVSGMCDGVKVCIFRVDAHELDNASKCNVDSVTIKIQNVNYAIAAKIAYAKMTQKHRDDLDSIYDVLDRLF